MARKNILVGQRRRVRKRNNKQLISEVAIG